MSVEDDTYIDDRGLIDVLTLPSPMNSWVWHVCMDRSLGLFNFWGSYDVTMDELAEAMNAAGMPGVLTSMH